MTNRTVFMLAALLMMLFFLASNYDRFFFVFHFLEALIYVVVLLLLFYRLDDWAYVIGFLTPLFWIGMTFLSGTLLTGLGALLRLFTFRPIDDPLGLVGGLVFLAGIALMVVCARSFRREVWGRRGALRTVVGSVVVVGVYYAVLVTTLLRMASPQN